MKIGRETGSVVNAVLSGPHKVVPMVGMGATILGWTDRYGATVVKVSPSGKTIEVQEDRARVVSGSGHDGSAVWEHTPNPGAPRRVYRLTTKGWRRKGQALSLGRRETYRDPSF
jgi:hypothetical protein